MSCKGATLNAAASTWVALLEWVKGKSQVDQIRNAKIQLQNSVECLESSEQEIKADLLQIARDVKMHRAKNPKVRLDHLLLNSRSKRQNLAVVTKKKTSLQQHLMALETSEMNQKVFQSIKTTSTALKSMGLDKALETVDDVMYDMEESSSDITSIQTALAAPFSQQMNDVADADLESELELLLADDLNPCPAPILSNSMSQPAKTAPSKSSSTAKADSSTELEQTLSVPTTQAESTENAEKENLTEIPLEA